MKLGDAWAVAETRSTTASTIIRQLALGGFALIWLFKQEPKTGDWVLPQALFRPLVLLIVAVGCDLLHYVISFGQWLYFIRTVETKKRKPALTRESDIGGAPDSINWPGYVFFVLKLLALVGGYVLLLQHLYDHLK